MNNRQLEKLAYYELTFDKKHCYKYQPKGEKIIIVTHEDKETALKLLMKEITQRKKNRK